MDIICKEGKHFSSPEALSECSKDGCERCRRIETRNRADLESKPKPKIDIFANVIWPKK